MYKTKPSELYYELFYSAICFSMIIPSVAGLPINIDVNGSAVVDLVLKGKADVMNVAVSPRSLNIDGEIRPSAALEITGTMSVDSHVTKTGLRMRNTLHTSTSLKGRIQLERGELFTVELDSPQDKMEVFDASSKFFILHNNVEQEQKMITENRKEFELCSSDKMAEITGAVLCGQVSFPNASMQSEGPYFPMTGPSSASLVLRKTDTHTGYKLLVKRIQNSKTSVAQISFNTPGSRVNRVILIDVTTDYPRQSITAEVVTPWKKAEFSGYVISTDELKTISGSLTVDSSDVYGITSEMKISSAKRRTYWSPVIEIRRPGAEKIRLEGYLSKKGLKSLDIDLSLSGLQELPYTVKTSVSNGNEEMSFYAGTSNDGGKSLYSIEASSMLRIPKKKITVMNMKKSLKINTPKRNLVLVDVTAAYKENSMLEFDGTLDIHKLMKRPASLKVDIKKQSRKSRLTVYAINTSIKSSSITGRFTSNINQKSKLSSMKTVLDYTIPSVTKNKITLSGKFRDKSTPVFTKYTITSDLDVKKNPEYDMGVNLDINHKKRHTDADLKIRYGPNRTDKTKTVYLSSSVDRRIRSYEDAKLSFTIEAGAPEYDVQVVLSGKHEHSSSLVDSDIKMTYGGDKEFKTTVYLKDKSKKRAHMHGQVSVAWPGVEYILNSKLKEEDKNHYVHDITLKNDAGVKHTFDTEVKIPNSKSLDFTTKMHVQGMRRVVVSGSAGTSKKNHHASAQFQYGKDVYALSTNAKVLKNHGSEVNVEFKNPDRRMLLQVNGEKGKHQYDGTIVASWDADRDENKKITLSGSTYNKQSRHTISLGGNLAFTSPFENFENVASSLKYGSDRAQHDILGKMKWGDDKNFMTKIIVEKPISLKHLSGSIEAETPFKRMLKSSASIFHTVEDKVNTVIKGTLNEENAMLDLEGKGSLEKFNGKATFTSTIENAQDITATVSHTINPEDISGKIAVSHNMQEYRGDLTGKYVRNGWHIESNGKLEFTSPTRKMSTSWDHNNNKKRINSKFNSILDEDNLDIHFKGSRDSSHTEMLTGELKIDSSRKPVKDIVISFTHKHRANMIKTKAEITKKGKTKALSDIKISKSEKEAGLDFTLKSPYHKDINGKFEAKYENYPMTASGEFQWSPRKRVTAETTLSAERWEDAFVDITLTTPVRDYETINMRGSNRKEGDEMVSHANLDYGNRNTIDLETRHAFTDQNKLARFRLSTPFEQVRSLETGLKFDGKSTDFDSSADFELVPLVGKFQGSAKLHYDNDMTANLRIDTPYPEYPYVELSASNNDEGRLRKSRIEARLHPRQVYSADATYSFDLPISIEANVNSPYPEYDNLGLVIQHNHSPSNIASHSELRYQPDKKIEGDLNADWSSTIEGSMLLKTPFSSYEENKVVFRHQGDMKDFTSHGEINVAQKSVVADAFFKAGDRTDGEFTLSSPIPNMERIKINVMKKGNVKNFKGEVSIDVNDEKAEVVYDHKLKKKLLKASFKLNTPYTKQLKLSIDHKRPTDLSFNNELSASYGHKYQLDTDLSFSCNHPDVQSYGSIKYKIGSPKNIATFNFNKLGALKDMSFNGKSSFNDDEINFYGNWKNIDGLEANLQLTTPFDNFKNTGINLAHRGQLKSFKSSGHVTYMDNKSINGMIDLTIDVPRQIRLDTNIDTPFETFPSASVTFNHNYNKRVHSISGDMSLTTPVADFGTGSLTYEQTGDVKDLMFTTKAKQNGKDVATLRLTNVVANQAVRSTLEFESSEYPDLTLNFDHTGDLSGFNTNAYGTLDKNTFSSEISRSGPIEDIAVAAVAKYNSDTVSVSGSWNSRRDYEGVFEVKTPFEGYESTKVEANGAMGEDYKDVSGKVSLTTTVKNFGTGEISLGKYGHLDDLDASVTITENNIELSKLKLTNMYNEKSLHTAFTSRGTKVPEVVANLDHTGDLNNFETTMKANVDSKEILNSNVNFEQSDVIIKADGTISYNIDDIGSSTASLSIGKEGPLDDMTVNIIGNLDDKEITIDGEMSLKEVITGSLTIKSPFEGFKNVGLSFTHNAESDSLNSEGRVNFVDGQQYFGKVILNRNEQTGSVDATVEINTPIEGAELTKITYTHTALKNDLTIYASAEYGDFKKFVYDFSASTSPKVNFNILIKTPIEGYTDLTASANIETEWPRPSINTEVNIGQGRQVTLTGSLDASRGIKGEMALATPMEGYSNVGLSFDHSGKLKNFKSEGRVTYMDGKEISGNVLFKFHKSHFNAELKTPFSGHKNMQFEIEKKETAADTTTTVYLKYGRGQVIQTETVITSLPKPGFAIIVKTPMEEYKKLQASMSYVNSWPRLELNSMASTGRENRFSLEAKLDATDDITSSIEIKTPIENFNNVGLSFSHMQSRDKFTSEGKIIYMNGKDINGKVEVEKNQWRGYVVTAELNTPFENAEKTKVELTLDDTAPSYSAGYNLNYGNDIVYSASGKLNINSAEDVDGSVEIVLPIEGVEFTKAEYQHKYDTARADGSVSLTYGANKIISGELKSVIDPYLDATLTVKTPFEGYESIQGSATYEGNDNKYGTSSSLNLGNEQYFSMTSDMDLSAEPFRASTKISTPYSDYRNMELVITHEGSVNNFRCTGFLSSPITDNINAAASMRYNTPTDMEASASIKSNFEGMDDLRAEIKNTEIGGQKKVKTVLGWTSSEQIEMDGMINQQESWYVTKLNGEWSLSTPFEAVRKLAIEAERAQKSEGSDHSLVLELNGDKMLDVDTKYSSKDMQQGSVTFRKPRAMHYSVSTSSNAGVTESEVTANWNRDETDSNVRITASSNDQSDSYKTERNVDIGLEYASRKMGVVHRLSSSDPLTTSFGKIYWDSDANSRIFYELEIKDSNRRQKEVKEGFVHLGLPSQTLGLSGSFSDNTVKQNGDVTFSWDTDRADKQVGLKGTITRGDKVKGDITLSMPAIKKEIRIDGELMSQNGRILLDAKTDISYSKDSRKTLTLTSKLEDISDYYSHYNYSLAVGVSHPYTNVDIQMTSHMGCSDEKTTFGLSTDYLTARRQNKNLGLLAEINKVKRQINLQITNPMNRMEYTAQEISNSPYQVRVLSRQDEVETFRSDFIMNEDEKSIELNMVEGSEGLKFTLGYPSIKEFRGEISRTSRYDRDSTEALLAVRLNTTRLMHTRLHWDPKMVQNMMQAIRERILTDGIQEYQTFKEVRAALSEEITGKYKDITAAFNEEVRPLVDELEKDFKYITRQMGELSKAMKKAYKNNDFYLQEMGPTLKETYDQIQERLGDLKKEYKHETKNIIKSLNQALDDMLEYPIQERYEQMVSNGIAMVSGELEKALSALESLLARTDAALVNYRERMLQAQQKTTGALYNNTYMTYISDTLGNVDVSPYMPSWEVPEEYTSAIYSAADRVGSGVGYVLEAPGLHYVKHGVNEVYQQGVWAYTYWQLEKNIYEHSQNILRLIEEIMWDELSQYAQEIQQLYYPITVWDPEHGEIQGEFRLPVDVHRLDEMPDLSPLAARYTRYLPDQSTLEIMYQYAPQIWSAKDQDDLRKELEEYRPSNKRVLKKGRRNRRM